MEWQLVILYAHILAGVFWVGHALFWTIVIGSLQPARLPDGRKLLGFMNQASWPPRGIPAPVRVRVRHLGWALLSALVATGLLLLALRPAGAGGVAAGSPMGAKLLGVATLLGLQIWWGYRPRPAPAYTTLAVGLVVVALSAVAR